MWIARLHVRQRWPTADNPFLTRKVQIKERLNILLYRDTAHIDENRVALSCGFPGVVFWFEKVKINTARPDDRIANAPGNKIVQDSVCRGHHRIARSMEPAQKRVGPAERDTDARGYIFRKARVICSGESQLVASCKRARRQAKRPLGGDVQAIRAKGTQLC